MAPKVDEPGNRRTTTLVIGKISTLQSSEMGMGPVQDSGGTQGIGRTENGTPQTGKHMTNEMKKKH